MAAINVRACPTLYNSITVNFEYFSIGILSPERLISYKLVTEHSPAKCSPDILAIFLAIPRMRVEYFDSGKLLR